MDSVIDTRTLRLVRVFDAPRERVFDAWTKQDQFVQWMCPPGVEITACEIDARPGGAWRIDGLHDGGGRVFASSGKYVEVNRVWSTGDVVELLLPMRALLLQAHPLVEEARNHVAICSWSTSERFRAMADFGMARR